MALAAVHDAELLVLGTKCQLDEWRALFVGITDRVLRLTSRPALAIKTESKVATSARVVLGHDRDANGG